MDIFLEHIVKKKKDTIDRVFTMVIIAIVIAVTLLLFSLNLGSVSEYRFVLMAGVWYGAYMLIRRRRLEYEYSFTNGELDVDVIRARRKRYHAVSVKAKEFTVCANIFDEDHKEQYLNVTGLKRQYEMVSTTRSRDIYFADFRKNGERTRLLFEPTKKMLEGMKKYNPARVYIKEEKRFE